MFYGVHCNLKPSPRVFGISGVLQAVLVTFGKYFQSKTIQKKMRNTLKLIMSMVSRQDN